MSIVDETGLRWTRAFESTGPSGERCVRHDCVEHPRVYRLWQANAEGQTVELYYVSGLANHWHSAAEAVAAAEANPA